MWHGWISCIWRGTLTWIVMIEQHKKNIVNKIKTPDSKLDFNDWSPITCQVEEQSLTIKGKIIRFKLPTIIEKVDNKWKRRLTTRHKRRYLLAEQSTVLKNYYKEKENFMQSGLLNGTIPSAVSNTADTSSCAPTNVPLRKRESSQTRCSWLQQVM